MINKLPLTNRSEAFLRVGRCSTLSARCGWTLKPGTGLTTLKTMNKTQENQLSMYYTVNTAVDNSTAIWTPLVPFADTVAEFKANLKAIEQAVEKQAINLKGIALDKRFKRDAMALAAYHVARVVFAYAEAIGDLPLREKVNFSLAELSTGRDSFIGQRCQGVHTEATAVAGALVAYGITAADLTALQTKITAYVDVVAFPRNAVTIRKGATAELNALIKDTMKLLNNRLDPMMEEFRESDPKFYKEYFDGRIIVDLGTGDGKAADPIAA